jgi:hypothetical protein
MRKNLELKMKMELKKRLLRFSNRKLMKTVNGLKKRTALNIN